MMYMRISETNCVRYNAIFGELRSHHRAVTLARTLYLSSLRFTLAR